MRLVQYLSNGTTGVGVERDGVVRPAGYADMLTLIQAGAEGLERAAATADGAEPVEVERLLAPLTNPGKMFGSGVNYKSHGDEEADFIPPSEVAWDFIKLPSAIIGPGDEIVIPPADDVIKRGPGGEARFSEYGFAVDYEVEFGVVIGRRAKNVRRDDALDYIFGYTVFNDVGSRSVQFYNDQKDLGKNFDTFCPMGPCIVTVDELVDWQDVVIEAHVNGERRQHAVLSDQIGPPPVAIEWLSSIITLNPGDCLLTGTPAGIGTFMDPPKFLQPGDVVRVSASGIGELENPVVAGTARTYSAAEGVPASTS
jgi:2-keto-4-pentenoate hydratase/2-oxohepta-3-ene-1,7-dioic acid hydratase in catechol pathway